MERSFEFQGRVGLARAQHRVNRAATGRIEDRSDPAAVNTAHRIIDVQSGCAREHHAPRFQRDQLKVQGHADRCRRDRAGQQALQLLKARNGKGIGHAGQRRSGRDPRGREA